MQKFAQAGEFVEESLRNVGNYIMGTFGAIGRYLNGQFGNIITPIRNKLIDFYMFFYKTLADLAGYWDASWERSINKMVKNLDRLRNESNKIAQRDKGKSFSAIFGEEMNAASSVNAARKRSDLWSAKSVDYWSDEIDQAEKLRKVEKQAAVESEKARKAKYAASDANPNIKAKKGKGKETFNDSSLAKIGGGGLTAARFDTPEKQLSETKKQTKYLEKISENTAKTTAQSQLLMK